MATVTATYTNAAGDPASGEVYLSPAIRAGHDVTIITEQRVWQSLDVNGAISIEVLATDDEAWKTDSEMVYLVEERLTHVPFRQYLTHVPAAGVDLADVQPTDLLDYTVVSVPGTVVVGGEGGVTDHGLLTGRSDDDHPQYLNTTRHDALAHAHTHPDTSQSVWTFSNVTDTTAQPADGDFRANSATAPAVTQLAFANIDNLGVDRLALFQALQVGDVIFMQEAADAGNAARFVIDSKTLNSGWTQFDVTLTQASGSEITKNDDVLAVFVYDSGTGGSGTFVSQDGTVTELVAVAALPGTPDATTLYVVTGP